MFKKVRTRQGDVATDVLKVELARSPLLTMVQDVNFNQEHLKSK
jgi:hypothetical protein